MPPSGRHRLKINGIDWLNDLVMAYIDRPRTSIAALSPPKKNQLCGSCWKFTFKKSSPGICNAYTTCSLPTVTESRGGTRVEFLYGRSRSVRAERPAVVYTPHANAAAAAARSSSKEIDKTLRMQSRNDTSSGTQEKEKK